MVEVHSSAQEGQRFTHRLVCDIPESWWLALNEAAEVQGLKVAQLVRMILGGFLRNRLNGGRA